MKLLTLALTGASIAAASAATYTTSFDGFTAGNLQGQDGWVAQTQWDADGAGNAVNDGGAFVRAHNTGVLGSTDVGESMMISTTFSLTAFTTPSGDIGNFEEGILQLGMSHQQGNAAFGYGIAIGLFYEVGDGTLQFRANQGTETGTSTVSLGAASGLGSTEWTMEATFTKTAADTWAVAASIDNLGDAAPAFALNYTASGASDLDTDSDGGGTIGGLQALPSGGGSAGVATPPFGDSTVSEYTITVTPIPEPSVALLGGLGLLGLLRRRR